MNQPIFQALDVKRFDLVNRKETVGSTKQEMPLKCGKQGDDTL